MKLQESISALKAEKTNKVTSRFPCRVLLLHSREDYCDAVSSLIWYLLHIIIFLSVDLLLEKTMIM